MAEKQKLTPELHSAQVEAYIKVRDSYETFANALKRVLERACGASFPEASVQARAKTVSSFAEKAARKFDKYPDAVNRMTDLCGARVIVQTSEQVRAVRSFIEANFEIVESEDKGTLLSRHEFGYRDMHYVVGLKQDPQLLTGLGFTPEEQAVIGQLRAEIQVRTWLQHAWADTLHDRIYKNKLKLSAGIMRTGALLAALMEEGDRNFNVLADELDGLIANYTAFATRDDVAKEIELQRLILGNERQESKAPGLALKLARLLAASGDHTGAAALLEPLAGAVHAGRCDLLLELGSSLCTLHRGEPASPAYRKGLASLEEAARLCEHGDPAFVPHLRKRESLHARALERLGWAFAAIPGEDHEARRCYRQSHAHEPANPYFLSAMLGFELRFGNQGGLTASMAGTIREAVRACREHAAAGIELPFAYFTAGRLSLLLDEGYEALGYYALGLRHCLGGVYCVPADALDEEVQWIRGIHRGVKPPPESQRAIDLLALGGKVQGGGAPTGEGAPWQLPVAIVAGGAASMSPELATAVRDLLQQACGPFGGTIVSGGTTSGAPGSVGDAAGQIATAGTKRFRLVGYLPRRLPHGVSTHPAYDATIAVADDFLPDQILRYWSDILAAGIRPADVQLLGFGGGRLSAAEYRIALGLGASVGIVAGTGGAADELLADPLWTGLPNLYRLPFDAATVRAFVAPSGRDLDPATQEEMAKSFHATFVAGSSSRLPANLRPWEMLEETFKKANLEQAHYALEILEAAGFEVGDPGDPPVAFSDDEVERMAELEHGRWNVERLRDGWRYSQARSDPDKLHDCLVAWKSLPENIKTYDRKAVRAFPAILAKAGIAIRRRRAGHSA